VAMILAFLVLRMENILPWLRGPFRDAQTIAELRPCAYRALVTD
jgi:hypothetical protein